MTSSASLNAPLWSRWLIRASTSGLVICMVMGDLLFKLFFFPLPPHRSASGLVGQAEAYDQVLYVRPLRGSSPLSALSQLLTPGACPMLPDAFLTPLLTVSALFPWRIRFCRDFFDFGFWDARRESPGARPRGHLLRASRSVFLIAGALPGRT